MKNQIIVLTYILFLSNLICFGQQTKFKLEDEGKLDIVLNGTVRTIKITTENLKNKSLDSLVYFFNPKGIPDKIVSYGLGLNVLFKKFVNEEVHYDFRENNLLSKLNKLSFGLDGDKYEYDENWNLISVKNYMSNILVKEILSKYDNKNRIVEKTEYLYGGFSDYNPTTQEGKSKYLEEVEKYEYNSQDKVMRKLTYNFRENKTVEITQYKYDENGNVIEEGNCLSYGEPNCEIKPLYGYEYNLKNLLIREFQIAKFSPHNTDSYHYYDEKGNEIEVKGFYIYPEKEPILGYDYKYEFDEFGNQTKEEESIGNYRMIGFTKYKTQLTRYDKFHNIISEEYLTSDGSTIKLVKNDYIYDKKGNWLKIETSEGKNSDDLKLIEVSKREIKYY